ncbi:VOC family protein [Azospirillum doebereinerae]
MTTNGLASTVTAMRAFVPSKDFAESQRFYTALGFQVRPVGEGIAHAQLGEGAGAFSFLLQDFYVKEFAENLMMQVLVGDLDRWWEHIESLALGERFGVTAPQPPKTEPWGMRVAYVWDPAGVLWHITAES